MYAVIKAGSRQFKVAVGEKLVLDRVAGSAGDSITFNNVLMVGGEQPQWGSPTIPGATVQAVIVKQAKGDKVTVFKYKRRKNYKRTRGHRQLQTVLEVKSISA